MPAPHPAEVPAASHRFGSDGRQVHPGPLARLRDQRVLSAELVSQADDDQGHKEGLTTDERAELVRLRREVRTKDMEIEILKRASA